MPSSRRVFIGSANDRIQVGFTGYGLIGRQHVHDFKDQKDEDLAAMCVRVGSQSLPGLPKAARQ